MPRLFALSRRQRWLLFVVTGALLLATIVGAGNVRERRRLARVYSGGADGSVQFVPVESGVRVEVVDYGGAGQPLLLVPGLGATAHDYARFARSLAREYRVYAMSRRGWAADCTPTRGFSTRRLGDDVAAVIDALHLVRPVLVGHSFGGAELSAVATYHPEKVAGLVYMEAGYGYALFDEQRGNRAMTLGRIGRMLSALVPSPLLSTRAAIFCGQEQFTTITIPVLAIFACPHDRGAGLPTAERERIDAEDAALTGRQADAFARQVPAARVLRIPQASHNIFRSHEAEVIHAIDAFVGTLPGNAAGLQSPR